ncbi:MAG: type I-E CRISPR-associated protein Cse1/CasA, partial [bacterium]
MKQPSFDVVTEPWIPVVRHDHSSVELGIRACLEQAHQFQEIHHDSPLVEFGLYRLLVAFVLDALGDEKPEDAEDLKKLLKT